jgi:hypothetical protein
VANSVPALRSVRITHRRKDFFLQKAKNERKGLCTQITQINADAEKEFFICVHLRDLRASPDSVAAGCAASFGFPDFSLICKY